MPSHWVLLRGLVRETAHWDNFPAQFAQAVPGAQVYCVDLPGNGSHWQQPSPLSVVEMMDAARQEALASIGQGRPNAVELSTKVSVRPFAKRGVGGILETERSQQAEEIPLNPPFSKGEAVNSTALQGRPLYLLSISLGGMVAVEWARRYPAELAGAVLINTSLRGLNPLYQRLAWRCWPLLVRTALTRDATRREARILQLTSALTEIPPDLIARRVMIQQAHPVRLSNVFRQLWAAARYAAPSDKPLIPLLLLNSAGDTMVAPQCSLTIAQRWEVPLKTHTWAGHDLPLDDPAWVVDTVVDWLNQDR